jgi:hypothetical protein
MGYLFSSVNPIGSSPEMARFTIHVPERDSQGRPIPEIVEYVQRILGSSGFSGSTHIRHANGYHSQGSAEIALVIVDAPDTPDTFHTMRAVAQGIKQAARQDAVYINAVPLSAHLI